LVRFSRNRPGRGVGTPSPGGDGFQIQILRHRPEVAGETDPRDEFVEVPGVPGPEAY
jgi:hypothetical protein